MMTVCEALSSMLSETKVWQWGCYAYSMTLARVSLVSVEMSVGDMCECDLAGTGGVPLGHLPLPPSPALQSSGFVICAILQMGKRKLGEEAILTFTQQMQQTEAVWSIFMLMSLFSP